MESLEKWSDEVMAEDSKVPEMHRATVAKVREVFLARVAGEPGVSQVTVDSVRHRDWFVYRYLMVQVSSPNKFVLQILHNYLIEFGNIWRSPKFAKSCNLLFREGRRLGQKISSSLEIPKSDISDKMYCMFSLGYFKSQCKHGIWHQM